MNSLSRCSIACGSDVDSGRVRRSATDGRVFGTMEIDEPHPRQDSFRTSQRFALLCRDLSAMLTEASLASAS